MKVLTFFNNKGGVGKTTLAVNVASFIATNYDKKILFIDADPQANSTQMMIPDEQWENYYGENATGATLMDYLSPIAEGDSNLNFVGSFFSKDVNRFHVDLIPGHPRLSIIEDILSDAWNKCIGGDLGGFRRTNWLNLMKEHYKDRYDYLIIDVGPSLGALNRSILINTDFILTPMGSDIFSLIGVSNISTWISSWMDLYRNAVTPLFHKQSTAIIEKYKVNLDIDTSCRLIGFSIQQYVTRSFKEGRRPVASYDRIIKEVPEAIERYLGYLIYGDLTIDDLNLGDVPYLYSLVPLAQSSKAPMYDLGKADGVVGGQINSVKKYHDMLEIICRRVMINMGELNED
ncbi:ParA family protein [Paenibacillus chitinolyticus]